MTAQHCRINLTHVKIGPRQGGGRVTDGGAANCYFDAVRYKGNTQHPKVVKNIFHWLVGRARAVARFGGVTPQCL